MSSSDDPFDDLLNLEEQYYREGYEQGLKDGAEAGRVEGYSLGLRKGFEKFSEAGRLQSKAVVWANRIPKYQQRRQQQQQGGTSQREGDLRSEKKDEMPESGDARLPPIHSNPRLEKNIEMLYGLMEPGTLSTDNDDEAVNDFDSRLKGAHGKLRIIERVIGEGTTGRNVTALSSPPGKNENIEDVGNIRPPTEAKPTEF
ncbi:hypothetical protein EKO27_g9641 [Xylaria grammica]|uniref:Essential protein Yae1 N-terminal domain-containing protein n=1 Tax=Xylaria grammica TaxID=363999 RepID=A0A439CTG1_9PEZI|nr:hypothetical protein EKO27_g9641 [Xylaria grammica]